MDYYDQFGMLQQAVTNDTGYEYDYDVQDRLTYEYLTHVYAWINTGYGERRDALRSSLGVVGGYDSQAYSLTEFAYDGRLQLTSIEQSGDGWSDAAEKKITFDYDADGKLRSMQRYADLAASLFVVDTTYEYDADDRLVHLSHQRGTNLLAGYSYTYDDAGRIDLLTSFDGTTDYDYLDDGH